jgi:hypothetical protein
MRTLARTAVLGVILLLSSISPAAADLPGDWEPYRTEPFEVAAGTRCPFTLRGDVLKDQEEIRTFATFPDGSPRVQAIRGPLVMRFTNVESGESVVRDLSGLGLLFYEGDGSFTLFLAHGRFAVGLAPTDAGGPAFLVFTGTAHSVRFDADGSRHVNFGFGPVENLCETLAA